MRIPFAEIPPEGCRYGFEDLEIDIDRRDFLLKGGVSFSCRLTRRDEQRVSVQGRVRALLSLTCSRCLEPYPFAVDSALRLVLEPIELATERYRLRDPDMPLEDLDVIEVQVREVDLVEIARQQLYLALPARSLCREDCRGLCPGCGCNRNQGECDCALGHATSPFAVLARLKKNDK